MFIAPDFIAKGTVSCLNLGTALIKLITASRKSGRPLATDEIVLQMLTTALETSERQVTEVRQLKEKLDKSGTDLKKTANELTDDKDFWRHPIQYWAIGTYNSRINEFINELGDLHQNSIALARCCESEDLIAGAHGDCFEDRKRRQQLINDELPLGDVLSQLISDAEELNSQLKGLI